MNVPRPLRARRRQRGSILIPAALAILIGVALLGAAQLGYFFYMKRELQKTADLAALTGVQVLSPGDEAACAAAGQAVRASVRANLGSRADDGLSIEPTCWRWARDEAELAPRYVREPADPSERYNAVAVVLGMPVRALFPFLGGRTLEVEAIAARPAGPIAAFSVGTGLLATGSGELTRLLKQVGLDIGGTAVLGYDIGLAGVKITPAGLLDALGIAVPTDISVAGLNQLLSANVSALDGVLDAVVRAASRDSLLDANVGLVQAIETAVGVKDLAVRLGSETAERAGGLFANIQAPDAASALNVELDALEVLATAIGVGTSGHAIACGVAVPLLMSGPARCSVVEPPSIAIGGVGATAYTSQIRVHAPLRLDTGSLLGGLVRLDLDIPLTVDVVNGHGTIEALCHARDAAGRDLAVVSTRSSLLKICLGGPPAGLTGPELANWPFSTTASCDENLTRKRLLGLELNLLGKRVNLASLNPDPPLVVPALQTTSEDDYYAGQRRSLGNELALGDTVKDLVDALLAALIGNSLQGGAGLGGGDQGELRKDLAGKIWADTAAEVAACTPGASGKAGYDCRRARWSRGIENIENYSNGLTGFLGGLSANTLGLLGNLVTLDVVGLLGNVVGLVGNLVDLLGDILGGILGVLFPTNQCATWSLLGGYQGSEAGCVNELGKALANSTPPSGGNPPNAIVVLLGYLLKPLADILNMIGADLLRPLIENVLGLRLGVTDVHMMSIDCDGKGVQLVY